LVGLAGWIACVVRVVPELSLLLPQYHEINILGEVSFLTFIISLFETLSDIFKMSDEEQMFLVDEEQADEDGETSVLWKKRHRPAIGPCESLPVYNTIHR
jgi:hypothetical protein